MSTNTNLWQQVYQKNQDVISRQIAGETLLVPIRGKLADMQKIFALNPVAEYIWQRLDGRGNLDEIHRDILANFEVTAEEAATDIQEFITELLAADLIAATGQ